VPGWGDLPHFELSRHDARNLVGLEFASVRKLQNPDRDDLDNRGASGQPYPVAGLPECVVHCADLASAKGMAQYRADDLRLEVPP
jgi:hypothetical protein